MSLRMFGLSDDAVDENFRKCTWCYSLLPLTAEYFYRNGGKNGKTYYRSMCKKCWDKLRRERAEDKKEF